MSLRLRYLLLLLSTASSPVLAQSPAASTHPPRPWYQSIGIGGYAHVRYNRLLETNEQFRCEQCDRSIGGTGGFFIRRARLIVQGQVHPRVFVYLQPDFATSVAGSGNVVQMRDWYADVGLTADNSWQARIGQSKVPFGFENLQSSKTRSPLDRADAINSAVSNERDLGVFIMWTPAVASRRFRALVDDGLQGSGDYGVFAVGAYNGQTANRSEANNSPHVVARLSYPFAIGEQIIEPGIAAYTGLYVVTPDQRSAGVKGVSDWNYRDERVLASLSVYPQPLGLLAEYNLGRGPEYNPATDSIETQSLSGGFVTVMYQLERGQQRWFPFARYQVYDGGKKHELDARSYAVNDWEFGLEWQPSTNFELTTSYYVGDRRFEDKQLPANVQQGRLLRVQAQISY